MISKKIETAEKWIYYFLCGYALFSSVSMAIQNIFLGLTTIAFFYRLYLKHDDIGKAFAVDRGLKLVYCAWAAGILLSVVFNPNILKGLNAFLNVCIVRPLAMFIILITVRQKDRLCRLFYIAIVSMCINGIKCCWLYYVMGSRSGGFLPTMSFAGILSMMVPVIFIGCLIYQGQKRLIASGLLILLMVIIVANQTRGAWVAVTLTMLASAAMMWRSWKKMISFIIAVTLLFGAVGVMVPSLAGSVKSIGDTKMSSNRERLCLWRSSYNMFCDNPIFGIGYDNYKEQYQTKYILPEARNSYLTHAHNNFIHMLASTGAAGAFCFLVMWVYSIWFSVKKWFKTKQPVYLILFAVITGLMLQGLTEFNMGNSVVMHFFWAAIGCCLQWAKLFNY